LSSSSPNRRTKGGTATLSSGYKASEWKPALPIAKHANLRVC
jgi:hypothetical protein